MATKLIQNGATAGALQGLMSLRSEVSISPTDYATLANIAAAIGSECVTANAALSVPMADADNSEIGYLLLATAAAVVSQRQAVSSTATDYLKIAQVIVASAKAAVSKLV